MTEHRLWHLSRAFQRAINECHFEDLENLIHDDIDWAIFGPIDMFPFLGSRHGKSAAMQSIRQIADTVRIRRIDREAIILNGDTAASMLRCAFTAIDSNRPITTRLAHFAAFRDGKLVQFRVLIDTFDLVEQTLGRPINLPKIGSFV